MLFPLLKVEPGLHRALLPGQGGDYRQQTKSRHHFNIALHLVWVADFFTQNLVTTTNAVNPFARFSSLDDGLGQASFAQINQVRNGTLRTGHQHHIGFGDFCWIGRIIQVDFGHALQHVKIGEVAHVPQQHHRHVDFAGIGASPLIVNHHAVFLFNMNIAEVRNHANHGNARQFLEHPAAIVEQADVAPELVDQDAFDEFSFRFRQQLDGSIHAAKHAATVNVGNQYGG